MVNKKNVIETKDNSGIKILPVKVNDILDYEVRIAECYTRNNIRDIRIRNDYFSIAEIMKLLSQGYYISPSNNTEKLEPYFQHAVFIEYWYENTPNFKQELKDKNIFPTFIIEHEGTSDCWFGTDNYATLVYCFREPIMSEKLKEDICRNLCEVIFNSKDVEAEIDCYNAYDYGKITNVTISNNIYVPAEGGIAHV